VPGLPLTPFKLATIARERLRTSALSRNIRPAGSAIVAGGRLTPSDPARVRLDSLTDDPPNRPGASAGHRLSRNRLRFIRRRTEFDGRGNDRSDGPDGRSIAAGRLIDLGTRGDVTERAARYPPEMGRITPMDVC
jgi:hypothetical protein